jgi:hypothetical protein
MTKKIPDNSLPMGKTALEIIWLTLGILSLLAGIYNRMVQGREENLIFLIMALLAFMMYFYRRNLRKSKNQQDLK